MGVFREIFMITKHYIHQSGSIFMSVRFKPIFQVGKIVDNHFKPSARKEKKSARDFFRAAIFSKNLTLVKSKI